MSFSFFLVVLDSAQRESSELQSVSLRCVKYARKSWKTREDHQRNNYDVMKNYDWKV